MLRSQPSSTRQTENTSGRGSQPETTISTPRNIGKTSSTGRKKAFAQIAPTPFTFFLKQSNKLVGIISLRNIERLAFQNGRVGYKVDAQFEGQGLMREGLSAVIRHAFEVLGLRRLEANVMPENKRSRGLLKRLGFREIGLDENYLIINGQVRPHVLTSVTKQRWARAGNGMAH